MSMPLRLSLGKVLPFVYELELFAPFINGICCDIVFTVAITNNANNIDPIMCLSSSRILKIVGFAF